MRWLLDHVPEVAHSASQEGCCVLGTVESWLVYKLTGGARGGVCISDVSNASRTCLMDLSSGQWHAPTCQALGVDPKLLPRIVSNSEVYGCVGVDCPLPATAPFASSRMGSGLDCEACLLGKLVEPHCPAVAQVGSQFRVKVKT